MPTSANITTAGDIAFTLPVGTWGVRVINESDTLIRRLLGQPAATSGASLGLPLAAGAGETLVFKQPLKQAVSYCAIHGGSGNKTLTYEIITQPTQGGTGPSSSTGSGGASNALLLAGTSAATLASLTAATAATGGLFYGTQSGADRKFTLSAAGAALIEAADVAAQRTALFSGYSLTGSQATSLLDLAGTWNTSGTPTALKLNITNTASDGSSLLLDLQTGSSSKLSARATDGAISLNAGSSPSIGRRADVNMLMLHEVFPGSGVAIMGIGSGYNPGVNISVSANLSWTNDSPASTRDLILGRAAAATLQLGLDNATTPTAQVIKGHNVTTGTGAALEITGGTGSVARGAVTLNGGNRAAYDASPSATTIRDILISHGLMAAS